MEITARAAAIPPRRENTMNKHIGHIAAALGMALALAALCGCSSLQDEELSPAEITLTELENRMAKATDPNGRYKDAKSFVMKQIVETKRFLDQPLVQMVETKFLRPEYFKITTYEDNQPARSFISNGESSWSVDYEAKKVRMLDAEQMRQIKKFGDITTPGSRLSQIFSNIAVYKCRIGDEVYYKVACPGDRDTVLNVYVDADTYQTERITVVTGGEVTYDSSLRGYGLYEGVRIPEETVVRTDGGEQVSRVIYCKLNADLDTSEFRPPVF